MPSAKYAYTSGKGLDQSTIATIGDAKNEPQWMRSFRAKALELFEKMPLPTWGADLSHLNHHSIHYYVKPILETRTSWQDVPASMKDTFLKLGVPQAEQQYLAGVGAQLESELIYKKLKDEWESKGVIFCDITEALERCPDLVQKYFATVIPAHDNKFAALNSAVWSGGSFVYVPEGVHIDLPLQAYFRMNQAQMGQFERTLIIADKGSFVHYVEGCSAPVYRTSSLHSAVVEIVALPGSHVRYTTIQNWSNNVYNLVTKRAIAYQDAKVEWIDGNFGSFVTMKYPAVILKEPGAKGHVTSIAVAGKDQHQDSGAKMIHLAPHTSSTVVAKSISKNGGRASYRGLLKVVRGAHNVKARVQCDALIMDEFSRSDTYPTVQVHEDNVDIGHEASVSKISEEQLLYVMSRGLTQVQASTLIVNGFIDAFVKYLPMEYAVEINRLIALEMENSIG